MDSLYCCMQLVFYGKNSNFLCKKNFLKNGLTITKLSGNIISKQDVGYQKPRKGEEHGKYFYEQWNFK